MAEKRELIQTGVDKLVSLVEKEKKISIADAAKKLSVPRVVVEEWVNFLEEKGVVDVEYKLTTPYIVKRHLSGEEIAKRQKSFNSRQEGFIRKIESTLTFMENERLAIKSMKTEFENISVEIKSEIKHVKSDLEKLEKYESIKKSLDSEILKQQHDFRRKVDKLHRQALAEKNKYQALVQAVVSEEEKLKSELSVESMIKKNEAELRNRLVHIKETVSAIEEQLSSQESNFKSDENRIKRLNELSESIKEEFEMKKKRIDALIDESKEREKKILELQDKIFQKAQEKTKQIDSSVSKSQDVRRRLNNFFNKKMSIDSTADKITLEIHSLESELKNLIEDAKSLQLTAKASNVDKEVSVLEKRYSAVEKKRGDFEREIKKLFSFISGK